MQSWILLKSHSSTCERKIIKSRYQNIFSVTNLFHLTESSDIDDIYIADNGYLYEIVEHVLIDI